MAWLGLEKTLGRAKSPPRPNGLAWLGLAQIGLGLAWLSGLSRAMHNSTYEPFVDVTGEQVNSLKQTKSRACGVKSEHVTHECSRRNMLSLSVF